MQFEFVSIHSRLLISCSVLCICISFINIITQIYTSRCSVVQRPQGVENILSENSPGNFRFVTLPLEFPQETNSHSQEIPRKIVLCDTPLPWKLNSNPRLKTKNHGNLAILRLLKLTPGISTCSFFNTCGNSMSSTPPPPPPYPVSCLVFFWNDSLEFDRKLARRGTLI